MKKGKWTKFPILPYPRKVSSVFQQLDSAYVMGIYMSYCLNYIYKAKDFFDIRKL